LMRRFPDRPATPPPERPASPESERYLAARPRQSPEEQGTPMRSISLSSQPFLRVKTNLYGDAMVDSERRRQLQNEEYKRDHKRIAAEHAKRGSLTDGSVFLNLAGLARHQADLIAKEYVKWHKSGGGPRPDLSKYENPVPRRKDGTLWDYREAFKRMADLDDRAKQYDYQHGLNLSPNILNPHYIWNHIHDNVPDETVLEPSPSAIYPRELERSGLSPHQYMQGVKDLMNLGLHHQMLSHLESN